jgi:hypothetical protein
VILQIRRAAGFKIRFPRISFHPALLHSQRPQAQGQAGINAGKEAVLADA